MLKKVYLKVVELFFSAQFLKFLFVGATAALANIASGHVFRMNFPGQFFYTISIGIGYVIGSIVSFILNKLFTFKAHDEKTANQILKFCITTVLSIIIASFIANILMITYNFLNITVVANEQMESIARIMSVGLTTLFNFPAMKYFSFKKLDLKVK